MKEQWLEVWSRYRGVRVGWGGRFVQMTAKHFIKLNWISAGSNKPYLWYIWYISEFYNLFIARWIDSWSSNLKTVARVKTFLVKIQQFNIPLHRRWPVSFWSWPWDVGRLPWWPWVCIPGGGGSRGFSPLCLNVLTLLSPQAQIYFWELSMTLDSLLQLKFSTMCSSWNKYYI